MNAGQIDLLDPQPLVEQAERRLTVAELAEAVMGEHARPNTDRAFAADWIAWHGFCAAVRASGLDIDPLVPDAKALVVFAKWLAIGGTLPNGRAVRPHAPESIRRRLTGVLHGWKTQGVEYPRGVSTDARGWVKGYQGQLIETNRPIGRGQAAPLELEHAEKIAANLRPGLAGLRDAALLWLGFAIGARSSELAFLDVSDITPGERDGLWVHVRRSKTKSRRPAVIHGQHSYSDPVDSWRRWQESTGIITGPALRTIDRHDRLGGRMSPAAVSGVVTLAGERAGLPQHLTGHSLRAGFATAATRAGKGSHDIAAQAGWAPDSAAMQRYIRAVKVWEDSVLAGIGL